jgi:hypothetical protein
VRIDRSDDGDERPDASDAPGARGADPVRGSAPDRNAVPDRDRGTGSQRETAPDRDAVSIRGTVSDWGIPPDRRIAAESNGAGRGDEASAARVARNLEYRETVDAVFRADAIDRGYARVKEIEEKTVTPAMRRIEAEDPDRHLAGLENRLKGKDRLAEKVEKWLSAQPDLRPDDGFKLVKDAIRYTFVYDEEHYTEGVYSDCDRLESVGFTPVDRQNSWKEDQYKGVNGRWREPDSGILFEVQFHTQESVDAKELTHPAYERIRDPATPPNEVRDLRAFQSEVCSRIRTPLRATEIPDYNYPLEG